MNNGCDVPGCEEDPVIIISQLNTGDSVKLCKSHGKKITALIWRGLDLFEENNLKQQIKAEN